MYYSVVETSIATRRFQTFNFLTTNVFPALWKMAKINVIFKKGCKMEIFNLQTHISSIHPK